MSNHSYTAKELADEIEEGLGREPGTMALMLGRKPAFWNAIIEHLRNGGPNERACNYPDCGGAPPYPPFLRNELQGRAYALLNNWQEGEAIKLVNDMAYPSPATTCRVAPHND